MVGWVYFWASSTSWPLLHPLVTEGPRPCSHSPRPSVQPRAHAAALHTRLSPWTRVFLGSPALVRGRGKWATLQFPLRWLPEMRTISVQLVCKKLPWSPTSEITLLFVKPLNQTLPPHKNANYPPPTPYLPNQGPWDTFSWNGTF